MTPAGMSEISIMTVSLILQHPSTAWVRNRLSSAGGSLPWMAMDSNGIMWQLYSAVHSGTMQIYCDGHLASRQCEIPGNKGIIPSGEALKIGGGLLQENNFQSFDEIAIWSRALGECGNRGFI